VRSPGTTTPRCASTTRSASRLRRCRMRTRHAVAVALLVPAIVCRACPRGAPARQPLGQHLRRRASPPGRHESITSRHRGGAGCHRPPGGRHRR
jgi:hypothetical protein